MPKVIEHGLCMARWTSLFFRRFRKGLGRFSGLIDETTTSDRNIVQLGREIGLRRCVAIPLCY
jgi:hypothetical protein